MFFFSYGLFFLFWGFFRIVVGPVEEWQLNIGLVTLIIYLISFATGFGILYLMYSYQKEWLLFIEKALTIQNVRWLAFMGVLVSVFGIILQILTGGVHYFIFILIALYGAVSLLNFLGFEWYPRYLQVDKGTPPFIIDLPPIPPIEEPEVSDKFTKHYQWEYDGKSFSLKLHIREEIYNDLKSRPRVDISQWAQEYVTGGIQPEIRELAFQLFKLGQKYYAYGSPEEVAFIVGFVQSAIRYSQDIVESEPGEYPKYPIETIVEGEGDCEDISLLGAAILKSMGYKVALLSYPEHVALGIAGNQMPAKGIVEFQEEKYYYVEMTSAGWQIGQIPDAFRNADVNVYPVPDFKIETDPGE